VPPDWLDPAAGPFDRIWLPEDLDYDRGWVFQHNLMELCTAVKGRALLRLIEQGEGPAPGSPPSSALAPMTACSRAPTRRF